MPFDDCYAALEWVAANAPQSAATSRIAVAGRQCRRQPRGRCQHQGA
ncbi:MAG: hypothetical protein R3C29_00680 [Dehalococcoidia bacterium]